MEALVTITYHLTISDNQIKELVESSGQEIDETDENYNNLVYELIEEDVNDNTSSYIEMVQDLPDVDVSL